MRAADWLLVLASLPLLSLTVSADICNAKPRDLPLEPRCIYRSPDPDGPEEPTPEPEPVPESTNPRVWELSKANGRFALSLYKQLALSKTPDSNIFMSPISISTAFAMTKLGACNTTLQQIMEENPEKARVTINTWISNKTENLIQDTLPTGALDSNTILVLVNTIYFKGQWKNKFDKDHVYASEFHVSESRTCSVNMMYQETKFRYRYFPEDQVQLLEMPYRGDDITMVIVLPSNGTPLSKVEESLDLNKLTDWMDEMKETTVSVHVPRFRVEDSFSLKEKLQAMGLTDLFRSDKASLPGMLEDGGDGLYISDAFHKAFLEVNEEGSEAAAATAVVAIGRSLNLNREIFQADRPFLLLIRESTINALLFTARVADPCSQ
uniref:antithrombin-III isoform X4 n=1 Tax=Semicossyphus pulcher TaxID=241346 RepID=UPI0037E7B672